MFGLFRHSMAEDGIDRINHTLAFSILLLLAGVTWIVPISPSFRLKDPSAVSLDRFRPNDTWRNAIPQYKATCFTDATASSERSAYTNQACASTLNDALKYGNRLQDQLSTVISNEPIAYVTRSRFEDFELIVSKMHTYFQKINFKDMRTVRSMYNDFLAYKTPFYIFIFAICLRIPAAFYSLLGAFRGLNIDAILEDAKKTKKMTPEAAKKSMANIAKSTSKAIDLQSQHYGSADNYFFMKFAACATTIALLVTVIVVCWPDMDDLEDAVKTWSNEEWRTNTWPYSDDDHDSRDTPYRLDMFMRNTWECTLNAQGSNGNVSCIFTPDDTAEEWVSRALVIINMYKAIWKAVFTLLVVLTVFNLSVTISWAVRMLAGSMRQKIAPGPEFKQHDIYFLLRKARENAGPSVQKELEESFRKLEKDEKGDNEENEAFETQHL